MIRSTETGKSGILLLVLIVGILIVVGAVLLLTGVFKQDALDAAPAAEPVANDTEIVNTIDDPEPEREEALEEEEETPMYYRTVTGEGIEKYIGTKKVKVGRPGQAPRYVYKIAEPTHRRMKAKRKGIEKHERMPMPHPSKRNDERKRPPKSGGEGSSGG